MFEFEIDTSLGLCEFPGCSQWAATVTERSEEWLGGEGEAKVCDTHTSRP
ncbi:hypothetical protein BJD57_gp28 [Gordonia phage Vivi2]|uniref:Uncharacterized protein n=2 Tax=Vividuovirus TaxID=2560251 RepID=A0A142K9S7_9CAUD|nr:hypothetical protein BJD57_gp28 [Gordonia phage Vivi2]YP_010099605.1 hypothetical protein KNU23_gp26 [Gordonia phage Tangent]AMS02860.1 hypothetical protein SEA_VIVI2_28 [Gordonia phage Vivi2]AYR03576.1 hypothetical protein SEA_TANGENT_26 [Gordonia phage Tangent]QDH92666.1 hypothetical protein SEA_CHARMING_26 [Gordonia phage Charming]